MIVLDTNVVSELLRSEPDPRVVNWLRGLSESIAITTITVAELLAGVRRLPEGRRRRELSVQIDHVLEQYRDTEALLPFDESAAAEYADLVTARSALGRPISTADAQIAAICRSHRARCATRNTKDFADTGVVVVNPWT